jgi:hypothetical protein
MVLRMCTFTSWLKELFSGLSYKTFFNVITPLLVQTQSKSYRIIPTVGATTFSIMTFSTTTFSITTFSITTFRITTFRITTLSIKGLFVTLSVNNIQYKRHSA